MKATSKESNLWINPGTTKNTAGHLVLHIAGNLKHFIGALLGETNYIRKRDLEFSSEPIPREKLLKGITEAQQTVEKVLNDLALEDLVSQYPVDVLGYPMTTQYFLQHLYGHLNYHLGQINFHRRIVED